MIELARRVLVRHAACAVEAAAREGIDVVVGLYEAGGSDTREDVRQVAGCVHRYLEKLRYSLAALESAEKRQYVKRWREFLVAYDDYLEVVRQARSELTSETHSSGASIGLGLLPLQRRRDPRLAPTVRKSR
ncbi:hypothetical protein [Pseudoxanthomonas sp. UC19_8]|uniref:hypothetical protein n=1 Tax=Pseudoxanthomonas sp. UC19_8 TaxID=3350175 RepID=UPI0036D42A10